MHTLRERDGVEVIGPRGWITYRRLFHEARLQPFSDAIQVQVDAHQAQLPSPLDQLVRLHHQPLEEKDKHGRFKQDAHGITLNWKGSWLDFLESTEHFAAHFTWILTEIHISRV